MQIHLRRTGSSLLLCLAISLPACGADLISAATETTFDDEPIVPIPLDQFLDPEKIALGERLFNDKRLSGNNTVACVSCHNLETGGTDRLPTSVGMNGSVVDVNSPTVFNASLNSAQFWDGRAASLFDQIDGPIHSAKEMDSDWDEVLGKLRVDRAYQESFRDVYHDEIKVAHVKDAIATFECSLLTPNSRFDRYLRGDANAISEEEKEGYELFKSYGCSSCHQGVNVGGNMYQKFGVMNDYFDTQGELSPADNGRFNVTGRERDRHVFKVPSLRNVAITPPYLHNGSVPTMEGVIMIMMARYQLGREVQYTDVQKIVAFLESLTGEYKGRPLAP